MDRTPQKRGEEALSRLAFIQLPEGFSADIGGFRPDPSIRIPVETAGDVGRFDPRSITVESILAGMLRVLAWDPGRAEAEYYRSFVKGLRPSLLTELSEAGIAKARNKVWDVAEEIFLALTGLYPEAPEPLLDLAILYEDRAESLIEAGEEEAAEAWFELAFDRYKTLLTFEPPFPEAFFSAGFFFLRRKNYDRAANLFESYLSLGRDADRKAKAKEIISRLKEQGYLDDLFKSAYDLIRMGRETEGLAKAKEFLDRNPRIWNAWFLLGWAYRRLGRWDEGRLAFEKALELGAEGADVLNELSICLIELGAFADARKRLERALRQEPENGKIITNLGVVALRQGKNDEAAGFFRAALEIEPEDKAAAAWLAKVEGRE